MMRIVLFLATNLAIMLVASITLSLLGVGSYMTSQGLDYGNLLAFCMVFGWQAPLCRCCFLNGWPNAAWAYKSSAKPLTPMSNGY